MDKQNVLLALAIVYNLIANVYSLDDDKEIQFEKPSEESEEFFFKYKLDNGKFHTGKTVKLINEVHVIGGANDAVYWVRIGTEENKEEFTKLSHIAQRIGNKIFIEDDRYIKYLLDPTNGKLLVTSHATAWDLDNICFSRASNENKLFNYKLKSLSDSRTLNGTTYLVADNNPLLQRIDVHDEQHNGEYEIKFSDSELSSQTTFCRGVTRIISGNLWAIPPVDRINPNLCKSLCG